MDAESLEAKGFHPVNGRQAYVSGMALHIGGRATLVPDPGPLFHAGLTALR